MDERKVNPYAPPVETADAYVQPPPGGQGGLSISAHGWATVESMAKWMRFSSTLLYVGAVLAGLTGLLSTCQAIRQGLAAFFGTTLVLLFAGLLFMSATWLRRAANYFYHGVMSDHESPLALGFRNLRLYLIMYGLYGIVVLLLQIVQVGFLARMGG